MGRDLKNGFEGPRIGDAALAAQSPIAAEHAELQVTRLHREPEAQGIGHGVAKEDERTILYRKRLFRGQQAGKAEACHQREVIGGSVVVVGNPVFYFRDQTNPTGPQGFL